MTYKIQQFTKTAKQLSTRVLADAIADKIKSDQDSVDFADVEMISSAFADELVLKLKKKDVNLHKVVLNPNQDVKMIFQIVNKRRSKLLEVE